MKTYRKRIILTTLFMALVLLFSNVFLSATFNVDAGELDIEIEGKAKSGTNLTMQSTLPYTVSEIDEDGYDAVLSAGFNEMLKNEDAVLYFNESTAEVALLDADTGHIWYSNPQDRGSETMVEGTTRLRIGAQATVTYYDTKGTFGQMDSYNDCIAYGNMKWDASEDKLTVHYYLGKTTVTLADVPQQISYSRMQEFASRLNEKDRDDLLGYYKLASVKGQDESYVEKLKQKYPNVVNEDTYYLTKDSSRILKKIRGYLDECGYTWDDLDYDNTENQVETEAVSRAHFGFDLIYRLEGKTLSVTLDGASLDYEETIPPYEITLLEYFGAGGTAEKGYMLLPDGSGTLVYYNNGKTTESTFSLKVYGNDTVSDTESMYVVSKKASLPVFGIKNGKAALLCELTQGEALCTVSARVAGMQNSYNTVFASALLTAMDKMELADSQQIYFEKEPYRGDIELKYTMLDAGREDYFGMAAVYRDGLVEKGVLAQKSTGDYPLMLDLIGAVPSEKVVAGMNVSALEPMTEYAEVSSIASKLDVSGLWLRLEGWMDNGLEQERFDGIDAERTLGGKSALTELIAACRENGWKLLPEVYIQTAFTQKGLNTSKECIRDLCRDIAVRYRYDYTSRYRRYDGYAVYQLNAETMTDAASVLGSESGQYGFDFVAVPDAGSELYSDFTVKAPMDRVLMQQAQTESLSALSKETGLALSNPNAYALGAADLIYEMPCSDSAFRLTDESVPFYQAVIRGYIDYVSEPLNYASDHRRALLCAVEYGAGLQYTLSGKTTALLKDTSYQYLNKGFADDWLETIADDYAKASAVLSAVSGQAIVAHDMPLGGLYMTRYADGTEVYVNYNDSQIEMGPVTVGPLDFTVVNGGGAE